MRVGEPELGRGTVTGCDIQLCQLETVKPPFIFARSPPLLLGPAVTPVTFTAIDSGNALDDCGDLLAADTLAESRAGRSCRSATASAMICASTVGWSVRGVVGDVRGEIEKRLDEGGAINGYLRIAVILKRGGEVAEGQVAGRERAAAGAGDGEKDAAVPDRWESR